MWNHRCSHDNKTGGKCKRKSTIAVWAFSHQGERFEHATWDEYCAWHSGDAQSVVSMITIGSE